MGYFKLPIGAATVPIVPSCQGPYLTLSIPFREIRGDLTGRFLLSKLIKALWGMISNKLQKSVRPELARLGISPYALDFDRRKEPDGEVGVITFSLESLNAWLSTRHPHLQFFIDRLDFEEDGVAITAELGPVDIRLAEEEGL